ncbi:hypothetical protein BT69DRAFT_1330447 [Atractiella rhizophila]|nr:hypothetical protein BT69DRAFT_1330447 [Atractiella rhizophila]
MYDPNSALYDHYYVPAHGMGSTSTSNIPHDPYAYSGTSSSTMMSYSHTQQTHATTSSVSLPLAPSLAAPSFQQQLKDEEHDAPLGGRSASTLAFTKRRNWSTRLFSALPVTLLLVHSSGKIMFSSASATGAGGGGDFVEMLHPGDRERIRSLLRGNSKWEEIVRLASPPPTGAGGQVVELSFKKVEGVDGVWIGRVWVDTVTAGRESRMEDFLALKLENEELKNKLEKLREEMDGRAGEGGIEDTLVPTNLQMGHQPLHPSHFSLPIQAYPTPLNHSSFPSTAFSNSTTTFSSLPSQSQQPSQQQQLAPPLHTTQQPPPAIPTKGRRKKPKDHVCHECGTTESPEWRRGPKGAKTLCNACGLRWGKEEKKGKGAK